ncbi:MAG TPA: hypothetical protein VFU43_02245 [Streptosporangiaceae bacterium]|nr:hypothetical protein [Streptosporangiaceae bacterium]
MREISYGSAERVSRSGLAAVLRASASRDGDRRAEAISAGDPLGKMMLVSGGLGPVVIALTLRAGRKGGLVVEAACGALLVRDLYLTFTGVPARLRPLPGLLLHVETCAFATATLTGLGAWVRPSPGQARTGAGGRRPALARTAKLAAMSAFGVHAVRVMIYLGPGHGRTTGTQ